MKNLFKKYHVLIIVLFLVSIIAACSNNSNETSGDANNNNDPADSNVEANNNAEANSPEPSGDVEEVNIGYTGPFSGPGAYFGEATFTGLELAVNEINEAGGFDVGGTTYKINLVSLDDKYIPSEAASNAIRLVQENNVSSIFIPHSGGILATQVFNEQENLLIVSYSSEPAVTEGGNSLTVSIPPKYVGYIPTFANYTMERFGPKLAALPTASQYGIDWKDQVVPYWESLGGEVVFDSAIDFSKDTDFFTIVSNALNEDPDVLFVGGPSQPVAELIRQTRELGFEGGYMVMDQAKLDEMMEVLGDYETLEGAIGVMPLRHNGYPATPGFIEKYQASYGEGKTPGSEQGFMYMGLYALVEAMKAANSVDDAAAIRAHMDEGLQNVPEDVMIYDIPGVHEDGVFKVDINIAGVEDGEVVQLETIYE